MAFVSDLFWLLEEVTPEQLSLSSAIIDFVITERPCDIDILRRALYCQVSFGLLSALYLLAC